MQIAKITTFLLFACATLMICEQEVLADQRPWSKDELETMATHVVVGKVKAIYSFKERKGDYEFTRLVAEVKIDKHEKGEGANDLIYVRYFTTAWKGSGPVPPGSSGHSGFLPKPGGTHRFYLSKKGYDGASLDGPKDGGFNIICPNGVQPADNPQEEKKQPRSGKSVTKTGGKLRVQSKRETGKWQYGSVIEVRSDADVRLLHSFRVPGVANAFSFTPDEKTLYSAEVTGNLGHATTIRAFDMGTGEQRIIASCPGKVRQLTLSPDGSRLAANMEFGPFEFGAVAKQTEVLCLGLINVWNLDEPRKPKFLTFSPPDEETADLMNFGLGPEPQQNKLIEAIRRIVPVKFRFSPDSELVISETSEGFITVHELKNGTPQSNPNTSSVNMLTTMKIATLSAIPQDETQFSIELDDSEVLLARRQVDGWWRVARDGKNKGQPFKVEGGSYLTKEGETERKVALLTLLGLVAGTDLSALEGIKHPLGLVEIETETGGIQFKLTSVANAAGKSATLRKGVVDWNGQDQTRSSRQGSR